MCRSVGSCFLSRKTYNAGSGKQTGTLKRSRLLQETVSAGRQTVRGSLLALVNSISSRRNYSVKPQYANARAEVPSACCLDGAGRLLLAEHSLKKLSGFQTVQVVIWPSATEATNRRPPILAELPAIGG